MLATGLSLKCKVDCGCLATGLSLKCEVDCGYLARCLPLLCEVVFVLPRWRLYWLREEFGTPGYCIGQNPRWRFPVRES